MRCAHFLDARKTGAQGLFWSSHFLRRRVGSGDAAYTRNIQRIIRGGRNMVLYVQKICLCVQELFTMQFIPGTFDGLGTYGPLFDTTSLETRAMTIEVFYYT